MKFPKISYVLIAASLLSLPLSACGGNNEDNNTNNTKNNTTNNPTTNNPTKNNPTKNNPTKNNPTKNNPTKNNPTKNNPTGSATLNFKATFGSNFGLQLPASWRPGTKADGKSPLVVMLCSKEDPTCLTPAKVVEVTTDAPVQGSFGPDVSVADLPPGDYNVMVFLDDNRSRERGLDWEQTPKVNFEKNWGSMVSEFDIMMSDPDESPSTTNNPKPKPVSITLEDGKVTDIGKIRLAHFHERRVDPVPTPENGLMAVVTESGLRIIDLNSFEVEDAGGGFRDYYLVDEQDKNLNDKGSICGMVETGTTTIYVLYKDGNGGFAVPFDAGTRKQIGGGKVISLPGSGTPCQGIYHENEGKKYLYLLNRGASGIDQGDSGLWFADVTNFGREADVTGTYLSKENDDIYEVGFNAIVAHEGKLFATMSPSTSDKAFVPAETVGYHTIFKGTIGADGRPTFKMRGQYDYWTPLPLKDGVERPDGNIDCIASDSNAGTYAGMYKASFHDGSNMLILGGCSRLSVFDIDKDAQVDAAPDNPRSKDIDGTLFGHGFARFAMSPDGKVLYALPQYKSQIQFYFSKYNDPSKRQTYNRYMILPLAMDQGDVPALHPNFSGDNIDDHDGGTNIGNNKTPAADPGIDINVGHLTRYQVNWAGDLAGSTNQAGSIPTGPSIAAGKNTIWLRGSGIPGVSGLSKGSNLMTYSVEHRRAHLWTHNQDGREWDYYYVWQGGNEASAPFGYDLTPENDKYLATYGLLYISLD